MGTILERSIDIPRDITFKGSLTFKDPTGIGETTLEERDLSKLVGQNDGVVSSQKAIIANQDKSVVGISEQTNTGKFTFDKVNNDDGGAVDLVFKRARGSIINLSETYHGNHVGVLSYQPYVNNGYIDSAGIDVNTFKKSYYNQYSGSEIIFSNSGGLGVNSGKHNSLLIDASGNTNILKNKELRLNCFKKDNFSAFRPSISTESPGYTMELPPTKGTVGDVLRINNVGSGGRIKMTSNSEGIITDAIIDPGYEGSGYDLNYVQEVNTEVKMTGGTLKENGNVSATLETSSVNSEGSIIYDNQNVIKLSTSANTTTGYYNGWIIRTINPNARRIISSYNGSTKTATLSSIIPGIDTNTQYKLSQGHETGNITIVRNNDEDGNYLNDTITLTSTNPLATTDDYCSNWTISVDVSSIIYVGTVSTYNSTTNIITINWTNSIPLSETVNNNIYSLNNNTIVPASVKVVSLNSNGGIETVELLDGGSGYIPSLNNIYVNLSSQNRLEWSKMTLEGWGLDKVEGTCTGIGSRGTSTDDGYLFIGTTVSLRDDGGLPLETVISNGSWTIELTNKDSSITNWSKFYGVVRHYDLTSGKLYINTGPTTLDALPQTNTTTIYKLVKYAESGFTGTYNNNEVPLGQNSTGSDDPRYPVSSSIDDYYNGWLLISYGYGIYDIDDAFTGVITGYNGTTKNANVVIHTNGSSVFSSGTYILSNSKPYGTHLKTGPGLSGGGNLANNVNVNLDLSTHDANGDTSSYTTLTTDKILLYSNASSESKLPTISNFLSSIVGTGLTSSSNGLIVSNSQNILNIQSNYLELYSSSNAHSSYYLNVGKNATDNINITSEYDSSENLKNIILKTQSSNASNNASIQIDIGNKKDVFTLDENGVTVKRGIIESITITNSGTGYTTAPLITISESPFGADHTATATCTISNGSISTLTIIDKGLGYLSTDPPTITVDAPGEGTLAILTPVINDSRSIVGQVNNSSVRYDGFFKNIDISGNQNFSGILSVTGQGAVELGKPSNLDFSEDDSNFIFGYDAGRGGVRDVSNRLVSYTGYKSGYSSISSVFGNSFYGGLSGYSTTSGTRNTCVGGYSGRYLRTNSYNSFLGYFSGYNIDGSYNVAVGTYAGRCHGSSYNNIINNVIIGYNALGNGPGGNYNIFVGDHVAYSANCDDCTFLGFKAGYSSTGDGNVYIGRESGFNTDTSLYNTFVGYRSGYSIVDNDSSISSGYSGNICLGYKSGFNLKGVSSRNIVIGPDAGPVEILTSDENYDVNTSNIEHYRLYIDTRGPSDTPLILGNQNNSTLQTLNFNADVTISNENSGGELNIKSGKLILHGPHLATSTTYGKKWKLQIEDGGTYTNSQYRDSNISFTTHNGDVFQDETSTYTNYIIGQDVGSGNGDTSGKLNILIGRRIGQDSTNIGSFNTIMGHFSAIDLDSGQYNTGYGYSSLTNLTSGTNNTSIGSYSSYNITTGTYNICIGFGAGPTTSNSTESHRLYIDAGSTSQTTGSDENSLIYGDQSGTIDTLSFNADVTIKNSSTSQGKLISEGIIEVEGGEIKVWAGGQTTDSDHYKINFPKGDASYPYRNIQITNQGSGISSLTADSNQYDNVLIGWNMPTSPLYRNTIIGAQAGTLLTGSYNTIIGSQACTTATNKSYNTIVGDMAARYTNSSLNTCLGYAAGFNITSGERNIVIGVNQGPTFQGAAGLHETHGQLYIDTGKNGSYKAEDSLIYGDQSSSTAQTLSFNADVTIKNTSNSNGNLTIEGALQTDSLVASLTATSLTLEDINIDVNPSVGRTSFDYNLFFTNNSHNVDFTNAVGNTFFGTASTEFSLTSGDYNTMFGYDNFNDLTTGGKNTVFGSENLEDLTTGAYNTVVGRHNMRTTITGPICCTCIGYANLYSSSGSPTYNVCAGYFNGRYLSGSNNVAIGKHCLGGTTSDGNVNYSVCIGHECGKNLTSDHNYLIGTQCGESVSGTANVGVGLYALRYLKSGSNNIGIGYNTCQGTSSGTNNFEHNVALGYNALTVVSTGSNNVSIGRESGLATTTGDINIFVGQNAGRSNTTGNNNTFLGPHAGYSNTSGSNNISIGFNAGKYLSSGEKNISIGDEAGPAIGNGSLSNRLYIDNSRKGTLSLIYGDMSSRTVKINGSFSVTNNLTLSGSFIYSGTLSNSLTIPSNGTLSLTSINNVNITSTNSSMYLGYYSGYNIKSTTSIVGNTYYGYRTGRDSTSSSQHNTFIGYEAGYNNTSGEINTCVGSRTAYQNETGIRNTCLGFYTGYYVKGSHNTCIGYNAGPTGPSTASYNLYIDTVYRRGTNSLIWGYSFGTTGRRLYFNAQVRILYDLYVRGVYRFSDVSLKKDIVDMEDNITEKINLLRPVSYTLKSNDNKDVGFIAQDVNKIFPLLINKEPEKGLLSIDYSKLTSYLVKGLQETNSKVRDLEQKLKKEKDEREKMKEFFLEEIKKLRDEIKNK